jgi:hypothetical protein
MQLARVIPFWAMKYYLYISDAKVDMLLPQISPETKRKVATELGIDLKIFKASRKSEEDSDENRISRLETVVEFIRTYGNVGTIDEPDDFIDDTQMMWSGPDQAKALAYFAGQTDKTVFGFAGSASNLIGSNPGQETWPRGSALNSITRWLAEQESEKARMIYQKDKPVEYQIPEQDVFHMVCALVGDAGQRDNGPSKLRRGISDLPRAQQPLEVFAKRLLFNPRYNSYWQQRELQVLLGTPLYVAMTD